MLDQKVGRKSVKQLVASAEATALQKYNYKLAREREARGEPIVWTSITHPIEIFYAMDILPQTLASYTSIIGAKQMSTYYLGLTEQKGYYRDLCRYCFRNVLGWLWDHDPAKAPWGGLSRPTCVVAWVSCDPLSVGWDLIAKEYDCPIFYLDRSWPADPHDMEMFPVDEKGVWTDALPRKGAYRLQWYVEALRELIQFLEIHTGHKMVESNLKRTVEISRQTLWYAAQVDLLRRGKPCPISSVDFWTNVPPWLHYRGSMGALLHMKKYYEEVKARADAGIGVVPKENYRLLIVGYPLWHNIGFLNLLEQKFGAVFVWEYPHFPHWTTKWDVRGDVLEQLAMLSLDIGGEAGQAPQSFGQMFIPAANIPGNVDGAVLMRMEPCKPLSSGLRYNEARLTRMGIPYTELIMDPVDIRDWDENKAFAQMANFLETIKPNR